MLFSEPKIPQCDNCLSCPRHNTVSVLFSEPKIPQWLLSRICLSLWRSFSALQRAENSSIYKPDSPTVLSDVVSVLFSEPKIPQSPGKHYSRRLPECRFSALQRAENSSIDVHSYIATYLFGFSALQRAENSSMSVSVTPSPVSTPFQCSSASRKFLNALCVLGFCWRNVTFQCSSASRKFLNPQERR